MPLLHLIRKTASQFILQTQILMLLIITIGNFQTLLRKTLLDNFNFLLLKSLMRIDPVRHQIILNRRTSRLLNEEDVLVCFDAFFQCFGGFGLGERAFVVH